MALGMKAGGRGAQRALPLAGRPDPVLSSSLAAACCRYAQYHALGLPVPDTEVMQAQLAQYLQQQQFAAAAQATMSPEELAALQVGPLAG